MGLHRAEHFNQVQPCPAQLNESDKADDPVAKNKPPPMCNVSGFPKSGLVIYFNTSEVVLERE